MFQHDLGAHPERHSAGIPKIRKLIPRRLLQEDVLVGERQALSAVFNRERDSRVTGVEQSSLLGPFGLDVLARVLATAA